MIVVDWKKRAPLKGKAQGKSGSSLCRKLAALEARPSPAREAAFNILNGKVIGTCQERHRSGSLSDS